MLTSNFLTPDNFWVLPDDEGKAILHAIEKAKHSVDIIIYTIGGPHILDSLKAAKANGANIRVMVNGQFFIGHDPSNPRFAADYAMQSELLAAPGTGTVTFHFASRNFEITHQKTVIVDADGPNDQLADPAKVLILTGNLSAFTWPGSSDPGLAFWGNGYPKTGKGARDFGAEFKDPAIVSAVYQVFLSDFSCAAPNQTNGLLETTNGLVWSNGTTGIPPAKEGFYPSGGIYPYGDYSEGQIQGNVVKAFSDLINSASESLYIYTEEFSDEHFAQLIASVASKGVDVRLFMTAQKKNGAYQYKENYDILVQAGAKVRLIPKTNDYMYVHAKALIVDSAGSAPRAIISSQNFTPVSLQYNRELGVHIQGNAVQVLASTFASDWKLEGTYSWEDYGDSYQESDESDYHHYEKPAKSSSTGDTEPSPMPCGPFPSQSS